MSKSNVDYIWSIWSDSFLWISIYIKVEKCQCDHLLLWWIDALLTSVLVSFFCLFPSDIFALISHLHCQMMDVVTVNDVDLQGYKHSQTNYYIAMHMYIIIHAWDYDESACIHTSYFILWFNCRLSLIMNCAVDSFRRNWIKNVLLRPSDSSSISPKIKYTPW